jgi:hypothetical protein
MMALEAVGIRGALSLGSPIRGKGLASASALTRAAITSMKSAKFLGFEDPPQGSRRVPHRVRPYPSEVYLIPADVMRVNLLQPSSSLVTGGLATQTTPADHLFIPNLAWFSNARSKVHHRTV